MICRLVFIAIFALLFTADAFACSCDRWSRAQGIENSGVVFEGRVLSVRPLTPGDNLPSRWRYNPATYAARFQVLQTIKGGVSGEVEVYSHPDDVSCGQDYGPLVGQDVTVGTYAEAAPHLVTGWCHHLILNPMDVQLKRTYKVSLPLKRSLIYIVDGDTIQFRGGGPYVRLVGFKAPEMQAALCDRERETGRKARARLANIASADNLQFNFVACSCPAGTEGTTVCNRGRLCGTLKSDGRDVGDILVSENLAVPFRCGAGSCPEQPRPWCE